MAMSEPSDYEVDLETFERAWSAGATVLDVRNPDEYAEGHVPGAVLLPLSDLADRRDQVPVASPLYVICAAGGRSLAAAKALHSAGLDVRSVIGGTRAWQAAGFPLKEGDEA
jgi:thioredoxin 1